MSAKCKGQHVPSKSPGERELGVASEARTWRPIPLKRISSSDQLNRSTRGSEADTASFETDKGHWTEEVYGEPFGTSGTLRLTVTFGFRVGLQARKDIFRLLFPLSTTRESLSSKDFAFLALSRLNCLPYLMAKSQILNLGIPTIYSR